ncbi:uncharacterized protein LOC109542023 [Dendroctonus ponderosae]|uniref:uncharacterized protein LOC109542023 n=1 Tax=Dendroctonus ponderosae TaxID=77166 RepID=UPI002036521D|nr:uncharacterized protein LOC109542023 [Dendroctonus ponderosae]
MSASRRSHLTCDNERSPFISERRRKLFPTEDQEMDSDLGVIIPISVEDSGAHTPTTRRTGSEPGSPWAAQSQQFAHEETLRTPRVACITPVLEEQKVLLEQSKSSKRPTNSPGSSPIDSKPDVKPSKVRTALFPADKALPTESFYSKHQEDFMEKWSSLRKERIYFRPVKAIKCKQARRPHRQLGQVNNGVGHSIKKPKQKKAGAVLYGKLRKLPEAGAVLNEYIQDIAQMRTGAAPKLIQPAAAKADNLESSGRFEASLEENKENSGKRPQKRAAKSPGRSVDDGQARNLFKCLRSNDRQEAKEPLAKNPTPKAEFGESEESDSELEANIGNILTVLDDGDARKAHQVVFHRNVSEESSSSQTEANTPANCSQMNASEVANMILSPISQMCDVASGLAIHSPVRSRSVPSAVSSRVSKMLSFNTENHSADMDKVKRKVFPIFDREFVAQTQAANERGQKRNRTELVKRSAKRFKGLPPDQTLLDAGQKKFGITLCNECNLMYHMGDPNDELHHLSYHNSEHILRFAGWKNEHLMADFQDKGRVIRVLPTDSKIWLAKVKALMGVVNRDLGCYEMDWNISQSQVYLYVKNRVIVGCVVATVPNGPGFRMLNKVNGILLCSEESYPIKCGVSHIWVAANSRQQGVGTILLEVVKRTFIFGEALSNQDVALTSPTEDGAAFAEKYFKTPNYLIYYS